MNKSTLTTLIEDSDPSVEKELLNYYSSGFSDEKLETLESVAGEISNERSEFYNQISDHYKKYWFEDCLVNLTKNSSVENVDLITNTLLSMNSLFATKNSVISSRFWINETANEVKEKIKTASDDSERLFIFSQTLFFQKRLMGNHQNYYDPQNSDFSNVIRTRLGIPISLSMVAYIIARKAEIQCLPANIPRHFMIYFPFKIPTFMDCFNIGSLLTSDEVESFLTQINIFNPPSDYIETDFIVILKRWFQNLVYIYSSRNEEEKLTVINSYISQINSVLGINDVQER